MTFKNIFYQVAIATVVLFIGFALSSGVALNGYNRISNKMRADIKPLLYHHISTLETASRHYFLFPIGDYSIEFYTEHISILTIAAIFINSAFTIWSLSECPCPNIPSDRRGSAGRQPVCTPVYLVFPNVQIDS